jgi:hypothetical protein
MLCEQEVLINNGPFVLHEMYIQESDCMQTVAICYKNKAKLVTLSESTYTHIPSRMLFVLDSEGFWRRCKQFPKRCVLGFLEYRTKDTVQKHRHCSSTN